MNKYVKLYLLVTSVTVAAASEQTPFGLKQAAATGTQESRSDTSPIAEYDSPEPEEPKAKTLRKLRGKRYDNWRVIDGISEALGVVITSEVEYPAMPVLDSDVVLIGEVVKAQAYLSNDRGGVYSEFTTRINEILKQDVRTPLSPGDSVTAERPGGRVRYRSGRIAKVYFQGWGMPQQGQTYLLFLKHDAERDSYTIVTGYELRSGKAYPIDGAVADVGNKKWPFDAYTGADVGHLLRDLKKEIANPKQRAVYF